MVTELGRDGDEGFRFTFGLDFGAAGMVLHARGRGQQRRVAVLPPLGVTGRVKQAADEPDGHAAESRPRHRPQNRLT